MVAMPPMLTCSHTYRSGQSMPGRALVQKKEQGNENYHTAGTVKNSSVFGPMPSSGVRTDLDRATPAKK